MAPRKEKPVNLKALNVGFQLESQHVVRVHRQATLAINATDNWDAHSFWEDVNRIPVDSDNNFTPDRALWWAFTNLVALGICRGQFIADDHVDYSRRAILERWESKPHTGLSYRELEAKRKEVIESTTTREFVSNITKRHTEAFLAAREATIDEVRRIMRECAAETGDKKTAHPLVDIASYYIIAVIDRCWDTVIKTWLEQVVILSQHLTADGFNNDNVYRLESPVDMFVGDFKYFMKSLVTAAATLGFNP